MPLILSKRQPALVENMDREDCDLKLLENTYRQFHRINALLSQWRKIYKKFIRPELKNNKINTFLDIGFGGGDIPIQISKWIKDDGFEAEITGIETDARSFRYASALALPPNLKLRHISTSEILQEGRSYDFVLSNHLIHHLSEKELPVLLDEAKRLSSHKVIFNDIERSDLGYIAFHIFSRIIFRHSFITDDGLISIRKSYTLDELRTITEDQWTVHRIFPYRLVLQYEH
ncbi:methyltransferase domain-containing protein [Balneola sp. MJW-20]|uniref:methyltransferase domain-containing protein n=1 Tax=Gracilimonas aurantiaca TaxID=3234185 RepID=UPI003908EA49